MNALVAYAMRLNQAGELWACAMSRDDGQAICRFLDESVERIVLQYPHAPGYAFIWFDWLASEERTQPPRCPYLDELWSGETKRRLMQAGLMMSMCQRDAKRFRTAVEKFYTSPLHDATLVCAYGIRDPGEIRKCQQALDYWRDLVEIACFRSEAAVLVFQE